MGITIHYQGSLDRMGDLPKVIEELTDIARAMHWGFQTIEPDAEKSGIAGIILSPGDSCESLTFLFDGSGGLRNLADLITGNLEPIPEFSHFISVKTQFAAVTTHIWIVGLLRYLSRKYISNLKVTDEGGYWGNGRSP